jgi:hypothetical protein
VQSTVIGGGQRRTNSYPNVAPANGSTHGVEIMLIQILDERMNVLQTPTNTPLRLRHNTLNRPILNRLYQM